MSTKNRFYVSPYFIARWYILRGIETAVKKHGFSGSVVDIGCGSKPYKYIFAKSSGYVGIDTRDYSTNKDFASEPPDFFFENDYYQTQRLPFEDQKFDNAVAFQVLEHHPRPAVLLRELSRIIRPGGLVLMTYPFLGGIHEAPHDYQRLTIFGFKELLSDTDLELLEIHEQGALPSTVVLLFIEALNHFASKGRLRYLFAAVLMLPLLLISYSCIILDRLFDSKNIFFNYVLVVRKK